MSAPCVVSHPEHATRRNRAGPVDSLPNCIGYVRMPLKTRGGSRFELPARRLSAHAVGRERIGLANERVNEIGGQARVPRLMNVPFWNSSTACSISLRLFMTIGPHQAIGSFKGLPDTRRSLVAALRVLTRTESPLSKMTRWPSSMRSEAVSSKLARPSSRYAKTVWSGLTG